MISFDAAKSKLAECGQEHALRFWDGLGEAERDALLGQIETIDAESIKLMQSMLGTEPATAGEATIEPSPVVELAAIAEREATENLTELGCAALSGGTVGVVLVAGGQGSRLGFDGPKGAYSVGPISGASLFEIHARKVLALEQKFGAEIPFYIMTSQVNDAPTRAFFAENDNFDLAADRVLFFTQGMWPALDGDGKLMLDSPSHIFMSPDGHGGTLTALQQRGMFDDMDRRGIKTIFFFQVDNPLVEIADPAFLGLHVKEGADISIKVCSKRDPEEGLGIVARKGDRNIIVEYSELTPEQMHETLPDGNLKLRFGSVAIHVFSVPFLKQEAAAQLPLHVAHKKVPCLDASGTLVSPDSPNAYKFEKFIFDVVPDAKVAINVEFERANEFSPVKNAVGNDSPATCQRDMMLKAAGWLEACGVEVARDSEGGALHKIEIDPCFALGAADLAGKLGEGFAFDADLLLDASEDGC
ncbi:MAG: UDPGP type 1 family protein [Verrucomicrobia bacterium]|nr:UDPGP type 1 family protein [Verrucomicrobiota bacterium]